MGAFDESLPMTTYDMNGGEATYYIIENGCVVWTEKEPKEDRFIVNATVERLDFLDAT